MVETLSKFGVPINGARTGPFAPKIKHRFRVRVINFGVHDRKCDTHRIK